MTPVVATGAARPLAQDPRPLVRVRDLEKHFPVRRGVLKRQTGALRAVDGVTFDVYEGETLGLVGESGCGKSTAARAILRLLDPTGGSVEFAGVDLASLGSRELREARRDMQMIFQDPYASLNPRLTVASAIEEPLLIQGRGTARERTTRVHELLDLVGLAPHFADRYPHEFSGGQRQRIGIARALATSPRFVVADEPIAALDVSIQAQIVNLLDDLKAELGLTYLFIAHDLAMVRYISDRVAVMYAGRLAEIGPAEALFDRPRHPYTRALLSAIPRADPESHAGRGRVILDGDVPDPIRPTAGCRFRPRCPFATGRCGEEEPELRDLGVEGAPHWVACHRAEEIGDPSLKATA